VPIENVRDVLEAVEPSSILPDDPPNGKTRDVLGALFDTRQKIYDVGDRVPAWWTRKRDEWLWHTLLESDVLASSVFSTCARLSSIPINIVPKDQSNRNHRRLAAYSDLLLKYYWQECSFQIAMDWQTQDNGTFIEVIGGGEPAGPLEPTRIPGTNDFLYALGLRVLDSQKCQRTGDTTYPVVYAHKPVGGPEKLYKFHKTRIISVAQMATTRRDMLGVGLSGASRCIRSVIRLDDIRLLEDELLGARPLSQLLFSRGIAAEDMEKAFTMADNKMVVEAGVLDRRRSARTVFVSAQGPADMVKASSVETFDLKKLPEGYDPETYMNLAINVISMALGFDPRELWPATVRGATRADAEVQHWKSMRKTPGIWTGDFKKELDRKWSPNTCYITFDQQDDEQDMLRAEIRNLRAQTYTQYLGSAAATLDNETVWQLMLEEGDITEQQFEALKKSEQFALQAESQRLNAEEQRARINETNVSASVSQSSASQNGNSSNGNGSKSAGSANHGSSR